MFGTFAVLYLFCGGTGAGAIAVCSLADLAWVRQPFGTGAYTQGPSVRPEARIVDFGFAAGLALLVLGIACLLLDLGRLDRVLMLFLNPQPTFITVGAFALAALALLGGFLAAVRFLYVPAARRGAVAAAEAVAVVVGVVAMLYTGLLLQTMGGIAFWASPFVPLLFLLSSLSGGMALVLLAACFSPTQTCSLSCWKLPAWRASCCGRRRVGIPACGRRWRNWRRATWRVRGGSVFARAGWPCRWAWRLQAGRRARCGENARGGTRLSRLPLRWCWWEAGACGGRWWRRACIGNWSWKACPRWRDGRRAGAHAGGRRRGVRRRALRRCARARAAVRRSCRRAAFRPRHACGVCVCGAQWGGGFAVCFGRGGRLRDGERRRVRSWRAKVRRGAWQ